MPACRAIGYEGDNVGYGDLVSGPSRHRRYEGALHSLAPEPSAALEAGERARAISGGIFSGSSDSRCSRRRCRKLLGMWHASPK
jgi:hypothetical protein